MNSNPHLYDTDRRLGIKLPARVSAKLATYRRQDHPDMTDEEVVAYLVEDSLVRLGMLELPGANRSKHAGRK